MGNNMNYNEFDEETKLYLNKAMDLYFFIRNKEIIQQVQHIGQVSNYKFTKLDKKILSLFIAGFMVDGNLKDILLEYDDLKLQDLLSFVNIHSEKIDKLYEEQYASFYQGTFQLDLLNIVKEKNRFYNINFITPELIMSCFGSVTINESNILNYFGSKYGITKMWFHEHPLFAALNNYNKLIGSISEKDFSKRPERPDLSSPSSFLFPFPDIHLTEKKKESQQKTNESLPNIDLDNDRVWLFLDEIQKKFIGQETTVEDLFYNIVNNQQLATMKEIPDGQRSIIFLDGPTGTGKTAITREITEKLGVPFTSTSIINYSSTGYVGGDITDILKELYKKANGNIEKAQSGIVVLDEFDKIAYSRSGGIEMKRAVQQQLLDFLGGGKYTIRLGDSIFDMKEIEFDTSKLTFVCLGALTDLRSQKIEKNNQLDLDSLICKMNNKIILLLLRI